MREARSAYPVLFRGEVLVPVSPTWKDDVLTTSAAPTGFFVEWGLKAPRSGVEARMVGKAKQVGWLGRYALAKAPCPRGLLASQPRSKPCRSVMMKNRI